MHTNLLLSVIVALIMLSDAYLRYLAFKETMTNEEKRALWRRLFLWSLSALLVYSFLLNDITAYKPILMLGWIPYLLLFMYTVRRDIWQHLFIFGMSALWSFSQHNWSSIIVLSFLKISDVDFLLTIHASLYLLWFVLFMPIERRCFSKLLLSAKFFSDEPWWRFLALLPLIALFGPLFLMADGELIHTHEERVSRIFLPLIFFFFYYIAASIADHTYKRLSLEQESNLLKAQLACLADRQKLAEENQKALAVIRHDMKHDYRMIHSMLLSNNIQEAAEYIRTREGQIENAAVVSYSTSPLINAALTIYFRRAENLGVKLSHKINLPQDLKTSEEDLAILFSNLLENAVNASSKQPENKREISLLINRKNRKIVIELTNLCDATVTFDQNGLPLPSKTDSETHGIGMLSVQSFIRKYNAYADFSQQNGVVKAYVYWEE
ncbi:MAG: GHKL domain-containing protein [Selenomonadaceae bacterium]|nr:GHKL domain-containing protein [Selenomonadaceae bacterium]